MSIVGSNIVAGASGQAGGAAAGYEIERSLRFNGNADNSYLSRTPSSPGNRKTWTWAAWVKRSKLDSVQNIFDAAQSGTSNPRTDISFSSSNALAFQVNPTGGSWLFLITTQVFRDTGAWGHLVISVDTTQSTSSNRVKLYWNGAQITQFSTAQYPAQNTDLPINNTWPHSIGRYQAGATSYFNGYLADVRFLDGITPGTTTRVVNGVTEEILTDFGEFDDNGVWQPIAYTFGTNPNNGTTWSSYGDANADSSYPWTNAFNGNVAATNYVSGTSTTSTWTPPTAITVNSSLRILTATGTTSGLYVNGSLVSSSGSYGSAAWTTITGVSSLSSVGTYNSGTQWTIIYAIEVDGYVLLDGAADNSFHLDFADNSSAAALGSDAAGSNDWTVNNISGPFYSGTALFNASLNATPFSDATGNEAITNNGSITTSAAGTNSFNISNAGDFGSAGQWLEVTTVTIPTNYTIDYYYKSTNSTQLGNATVIDSNGEVFIRDYGSATSRSLRLNDGSATNYSYTITNNTWNHVRITNTGIWVNGTSINSSPKNIAGRSAGLTIGSYNNDDSYRFDGLIGPVRILDADLGAPTAGGEPTDSGSLPNIGTGASTGADNDSLRDSPTNGDTANDTGLGGEVPGNYATMSPNVGLVDYTLAPLSNGNLQVNWGASNTAWCDWGLTSGKWYYETTMLSGVSSGTGNWVRAGRRFSTSYNAFLWRSNGGTTGLTGSPTFSTYANGDTLGVAIDVDNEQVTFYKNGVLQGTGAYSYTTAGGEPIYIGGYANVTSSTAFNFGQRPYAYQNPGTNRPSTDYKPLCTAFLPTPTIEDGSTAMDVVTYSGNGSTKTISGLGFSPDFVWIRRRNLAGDHQLYDIVRGTNNGLSSNLSNTEWNYGNGLTAFNSDGFTLGDLGGANRLNDTHVAFCWDAGSSTVSNTDGSLTSSVRTNNYLSIVTYTGTGSAATVGHGLNNVAPSMIIVKNRTSGTDWAVGHASAGWSVAGNLNNTNSFGASSYFNSTAPTSTVFSVGASGNSNGIGDDMVAYCFAPVENYSAFGIFTGNGQSGNSAPFIWTGFRPSFLMIKCSSSNQGTNAWWLMFDNKRVGYNPDNAHLGAQDSAYAEYQASAIDLLSNGFKIRDSNTSRNASGATYVYACFAESPFRSARAR